MLSKLFGSANDRYIKSLRKIVKQINEKEPELEALSDDELKGRTLWLKERLAQGETLTVPTQFHSRYVRSYSPTVYYYTTPVPGDEGVQLVCGTDYAVVDKDGNTLTPNASGAYEMTWPNAAGGVLNIYIKALNGSKGSFRVLTFDPNETMDVTDVATTTIVKTDEYEVRAFSENYYVTVTVE